MARGKIQIKRIENSTNRQVTYSKRRNGLFKKANELTVLCDAKVSLIMVSSTDKVHEYISPSISTKEFFDEYQRITNIDLWETHYKNMQDNLKKLKEVNRNLRREIRLRIGEGLNGLKFKQICALQQEVEESLKVVRERKYKVLSTKIETTRKKVKHMEVDNRRLQTSFTEREEDPQYGIVDNGGGEYGSVIRIQSGGQSMYLPYTCNLFSTTSMADQDRMSSKSTLLLHE